MIQNSPQSDNLVFRPARSCAVSQRANSFVSNNPLESSLSGGNMAHTQQQAAPPRLSDRAPSAAGHSTSSLASSPPPSMTSTLARPHDNVPHQQQHRSSTPNQPSTRGASPSSSVYIGRHGHHYALHSRRSLDYSDVSTAVGSVPRLRRSVSPASKSTPQPRVLLSTLRRGGAVTAPEPVVRTGDYIGSLTNRLSQCKPATYLHSGAETTAWDRSLRPATNCPSSSLSQRQRLGDVNRISRSRTPPRARRGGVEASTQMQGTFPPRRPEDMDCRTGEERMSALASSIQS